MRFVIGLICGGVLILVVAQQPDGRWLREAPAWLDRLAEAAGDALALPPRPAGAAEQGDVDPAAEVEAAALSAGVEPAQLPIPRPPDAPAPAADRARAPLADRESAAGARMPATESAVSGPSAPAPEPAGEDVRRLVAGIFERPAGADDPAQEPSAGPGPAAVAAGSPAPGLAGRDAARTRRAPVWVPFHSRMSADGFAERLSESLDHPFRVERQGPGRYQVVFAYADEAQRVALLDEASAVTGLPL